MNEILSKVGKTIKRGGVAINKTRFEWIVGAELRGRQLGRQETKRKLEEGLRGEEHIGVRIEKIATDIATAQSIVKHCVTVIERFEFCRQLKMAGYTFVVSDNLGALSEINPQSHQDFNILDRQYQSYEHYMNSPKSRHRFMYSQTDESDDVAHRPPSEYYFKADWSVLDGDGKLVCSVDITLEVSGSYWGTKPLVITAIKLNPVFASEGLDINVPGDLVTCESDLKEWVSKGITSVAKMDETSEVDSLTKTERLVKHKSFWRFRS